MGTEAESKGTPEAPQRGRRRRSWRRRAVLAALVLAGLYLLRGPLLHPLLARGLAALASRAGVGEVTIRGIEGDWFRTLGVRGLSLSSAEGPLESLSIESADLRFRLGSLIWRRDLTALESVTLDGVRARVDLSAGGKEPAGPAPKDVPWPSLPSHVPAVEASRVALDLCLDGARGLRLEELRIHSSGTPQDRLFAIQAPVAQGYELGDGQAPTRTWTDSADLSVQLSGTSVNLERVRLGTRVLAEEFVLDGSELPRKKLAWRGRLANGEVSTEGGLHGSDLRGRLKARDLDLSDWAAALPATFADLAGRVQTTAEIEWTLGAPHGPRANVNLDATELRQGGTRIDELHCTGSFENGALTLSSLSARQGTRNRLELDGLRLPLDAGWPGLLQSAAGELSLECTDLSRLPLANPLADKGALPPHRIVLTGRLAEGRIVIEEGRVDVPDGIGLVERASVDLRGGGDVLDWPIDVEAQVDVADLAPLAELWGSRGAAGELSGQVSIDGTLGQPSGRAACEGRGVRLAGLDLGALDLSLQARRGRLDLDRLECVGALGNLLAEGRIDLGARTFEALTIEGRLLDSAPLGLTPEGGWKLDAPLHLAAELAGPFERPSGDLRLSGAEALIAGQALSDLRVTARLERGDVDGAQLSFESPYARCRLSGSAAFAPAGGLPATLAIESLVLSRGPTEVALERPVEGRFDASGFALDPARLSGSAGLLELEASGQGQAFRARVRAEGLDLTHFLAHTPFGLAGIEASVDIAREAPVSGATPTAGLTLASEGRVAEVRVRGMREQLAAAWSAELDGGRLRLGRTTLRSGESVLLDAEGEAPLDPLGPSLLPPGALALDVEFDLERRWTEHLPLPDALGSLEGTLRGDLQVEGSWREPRGRVHLDARELSASRLMLTPPPEKPASLDLDLELGETWALSLVGLLPERAEISVDAELAHPLDLIGGLEDPDALVEALRAAPLETRVDLNLASASDLRPLLTGIRRIDGRLSAQVRTTGSLDEPRIEGDAALTDGALRLSSEMPALEQLDARVRLDGQTLELLDVRGEMGAAPVTLRGQVAWSEGPPTLDLSIDGEEVLLLRTPSARLRADTALHLHGPLAAPRLEGTLGLRAARISQNVDLLPSASSLAASEAVRADVRGFQLFTFTEPPLSDMVLDLKIETVEPLVLTTNLASSSWNLDLHLGGTGRVPLPQGQIFMERTRLKLPGGVMRFDAGRVLFSRGNPFLPTLEMAGETRLAGYDISMVVKGPYDDPEAILSSTPPLASTDLLLLVLTGEPPVGDLGGSSARAAQSITLYLAKDLIQRLRSRDLEEDGESLFDRLEIIQGRDVSKSGTATTEASFRLQRDVLGEGDAFYLVADRDVYEQFNMGLRVVFRFQ